MKPFLDWMSFVTWFSGSVSQNEDTSGDDPSVVVVTSGDDVIWWRQGDDGIVLGRSNKSPWYPRASKAIHRRDLEKMYNKTNNNNASENERYLVRTNEPEPEPAMCDKAVLKCDTKNTPVYPPPPIKCRPLDLRECAPDPYRN